MDEHGYLTGEDFEVDMIDYYANGIDELRRYRAASIFLADVPPDAGMKPRRTSLSPSRAPSAAMRISHARLINSPVPTT